MEAVKIENMITQIDCYKQYITSSVYTPDVSGRVA